MNAIKTPTSIYWITFLLVVFFYSVSSGFNPVSLNVYWHFILFGLVLTICYKFFLWFFNLIDVKDIKKNNFSKLIVHILNVFSTILFMFVLNNAIGLFLSGNVTSMMELRSTTSSENSDVSLGVGLAFPTILASWYIAKFRNNYLLSYFFAFALLVTAILSTSKIFFIVILFYFFYFSKISSVKLVFFPIVCAFLFSMSHIVLGKFSSDPSVSLSTALINTFAVYFVGGFAAYQHLIDNYVTLDPLISLVGLRKFEYLIPFCNLPESAILPWVKIGNWNTNLYTAFGYWYSAFGSTFLLFVPIVMSFYFALFNSAGIGRYFVFYRPFLLFSVFFIFFGDFFMPAFPMHLMYLFYSFIVYFSTRPEL